MEILTTRKLWPSEMNCWKVTVVLAATVLALPFACSKGGHGALLQINSYTHPDGLERINGSHGERGCGSLRQTTTPPLCMASSTSVPSDLNDGVFPDPQGAFRNNWAEGFFTVRRGNSSTIEIGFKLQRSVVVGQLQLSLLNCPSWGIGAPKITLYGADLNGFPAGVNTALAIPLGTLTFLSEDISCTVQTQTIATSQEGPHDQSFQYYYLIISYETDSTIIWSFLGEVQFFEPLNVDPSFICMCTLTTSCSSCNLLQGIMSSVAITTTPYSTQHVQPTNVTIPKKKSDHHPPLIPIIAVAIAVLFLCVLTLVFCVCTFYLVTKKRKRRNTVEEAKVTHVYSDITDFQGGNDDEVVNHEYETIDGGTLKPESPAKIPVQHNRAYAAHSRPSIVSSSVEPEHYYY